LPGQKQSARPSKKRFRFPLWRFGEAPKARKERLARLHELAEEGQRLADLMASPSWAIVEHERAYWHTRNEADLHNPLTPDRRRSDLVHEWAGVEGFFKALHYRIERGKQAREELQSERLP
jgi:hypothetical protein